MHREKGISVSSAAPSPTATAPVTPARAGTVRLVALVIGIPLALGLLVLAFLWPAATATVAGLPVAIVAPDAPAAALEGALEDHAPGVFVLERVDDRAAGVDAIESRAVYGAIVLDPEPEVLVASAASPLVAQQLTALAPALGAQLTAAAAAQGIDLAATVTVAVTDVVPLADGDPRGAVLAASSFPLVLGGVISGAAILLLVRGAVRRLVALALVAIGAGLVVAVVLQGILGAVPGGFLALALAAALGLLAISATVTGLGSVLGRPGMALGALTMVLVGNPLSAAALPVEFLADPWGAVGQALPPGAAVTLLRNVAYFPAADSMTPALILGVWAAAGLVLVALGALRSRRSALRATEGVAIPAPVA